MLPGKVDKEIRALQTWSAINVAFAALDATGCGAVLYRAGYGHN
jgi:hypothetical protein